MNIRDLSSWGLSKAVYDVIEKGFSYDEETGEIFFTSEDLDELQESLDNKLNGICGYIDHLKDVIDSHKNRKKSIDNNISFYERKKERLESFLKIYMDAHEITKKELSDYRLGFRKSSKIEIFDEEKLMKYLDKNPEIKKKCLKVKTEVSFSKSDLKEALKDNDIDGVKIVENKNIVIK